MPQWLTTETNALETSFSEGIPMIRKLENLQLSSIFWNLAIASIAMKMCNIAKHFFTVKSCY